MARKVFGRGPNQLPSASWRYKRKVRKDLTVIADGTTYRIVPNAEWTPTPGETVWVCGYQARAASVAPLDRQVVPHPTLAGCEMVVRRSARLEEVVP